MSSRKNQSRKQPIRPSHPPDNSSTSLTPAGRIRVVGVLVDQTSSVLVNTTTDTPLKEIIKDAEERLTQTLQNSFQFARPPKIDFCQIGPVISTSRQTDVGNSLLHRVADVSLPEPMVYATFIPTGHEAISNRLKEDNVDAKMYRLQESTQTGGANMLQLLEKLEALQKSVEQLSANDARSERRHAEAERRHAEAERRHAEAERRLAEADKRLAEAVADRHREVAKAVMYGEKRLAEAVARGDSKVETVKKKLQQCETSLHKLCRRSLLDQARSKILAHTQFRDWFDLYDGENSDQVFQMARRVFHNNLTRPSFDLVCVGANSIRQAGNMVAHPARESEILEAVEHTEEQYRSSMQNIYQCVFLQG